ncbi:hypothetical protein HYU15_04290 [Candidatus Woesearchaeota archaeon]|nr:hypothetical protein [Candidatus Woesearchaeota archaeon]
MAQVIVTLRIMPDSPDTDLAAAEELAGTEIERFGGKVAKKEISPVAFGLKALVLYLIIDESRGGTEPLEKKLAEIKGVLTESALHKLLQSHKLVIGNRACKVLVSKVIGFLGLSVGKQLRIDVKNP